MSAKIPLGLGLRLQNSKSSQPKAKGEIKTPQNAALSNKERIIKFPEPESAREL
ncbi:MAG: hypothetical protein LBS21_08285 [Clostridiales bacterium]|jgi:hypothetical protein|nr:hypothetical protein [Clostridiales bacterium]